MTRRFRLGATLALLSIGIAFWLYWPLPYLGIDIDPATGRILAVAPGSSAAQGGLLPGDQIITIYGYPWAEMNSRLLLVPLPWREGMITPLQALRDGETLAISLDPGRASAALQIEKVLRALAAFTCWATGVFLASTPQAANPRLRWAAWFWVALGATLGLLLLFQSVSDLLLAAVLWLLSTILAPTAVLMHLWYPSRPLATETLLRAQRWWLVALLLLQGTFVIFVVVGHTTIGLLQLLDTSTIVVFLGSFVLSAGVLWKAYQETTISHIRRQIRLIAWACAVVACVWLFVLLGQVVAPTLIGVVPPVTFTVVAIVVPLAYLVGGVGRDLLRVDLLARQLVIHAGTFVALVALLAVVGQLNQRTLAPTLLVAVSVALYRPMFGLIQRLPVFGRAEERAFERLGATTTLLGSTLEAPQLARIVSDGVRDAFRNPPLALYLQHSPSEQRLKRIVAQRLLTPERVGVATLSQLVQRDEVLVSTGTLQQRAASRGLDTSDAALIYAPRASLWGLLRDTRGSPIGLLVLGPRGDLDPYREQDMRELGRLLGAAALAFTNSAAYEKQVRAERVIRKLYHRLQEIQDEAEAMIARELHHVLNVSVRLNIEALERVLKRAELVAPELSDELEELLETEQAAGVMLRLLCDSLVLTNRSEPRSLASSLRRTAEHAAAGWEGALHVQVDQVPVDIAPLVYRELVVITREGVTNAVKHGQANEIVVALRVPAGEDQPLVLSIRNDGPLQGEIMAKAGHVGLHFMHESAARIGATIAWIPQATGGVDVVVTAPRVGRPEPDDSGLLSDWGGIVPTINSDDTGESPTRPEDTVKRGDLQ